MTFTAFLRAAWALLRRVPWQVWAVLAIAALIAWHGHTRYGEGVADERASWEKVVAQQNAKADREAREKEAAQRKHNIEVRRQYEADLSTILADRNSLAQRLRRAQAAGTRCPVPEAAGGSGAADAGPESGGQAEAPRSDSALDAYDQACRLDAVQLNRLIEQLRPQLAQP